MLLSHRALAVANTLLRMLGLLFFVIFFIVTKLFPLVYDEQACLIKLTDNRLSFQLRAKQCMEGIDPTMHPIKHTTILVSFEKHFLCIEIT